MAATAFDMTRNFSLYSVPAAWFLAMLPHWYAVSQYKFNNTSPRSYVKDIDADQRIDKATKARLLRAEGAQLNGFENLGPYAAAVVIGNVAKLDNWTLNALSATYLASRVVFNVIYINHTTAPLASVRSAVYFVGIGVIFTFFIKSGNVLVDRP